MKKRDLLMLGLVMALSLPLNVWAATTLGESLSVDDGGSPDTTLGAGDAYIEGILEVDGGFRLDGSASLVATNDTTFGTSLAFYHDSTASALGDEVGTIVFAGNDDMGGQELYGQVSGYIMNAEEDIEQGLVLFSAANGDGNTYIAGGFAVDTTDAGILVLGDPLDLGGPVDGIISAGSNGNITIDPDGNGVFVRGGAVASDYDSLTGPGAIQLDFPGTTIETTGADAYTLDDGLYDGQEIDVMMINHVGDGTLTPTTALGYTSITFDGAGDVVRLKWIDGSGWAIMFNNGVTAS